MERRESCCDDIVTVKTKVKVHCDDIRGLKQLYKPVWGLCVMFVIVSLLVVGLWTDVRTSNASLKVHEQQDNAEFYELSNRMSVIEGKYEVIIDMLNDIKSNQEKLLEVQRLNGR